MNKVEYEKKRDELFEKWQNSQPEFKEEGNRFSLDGIMNFEAWIKSKPKILFLLKENHSEDDWEPSYGITRDANIFSLNIVRWRKILI